MSLHHLSSREKKKKRKKKRSRQGDEKENTRPRCLAHVFCFSPPRSWKAIFPLVFLLSPFFFSWCGSVLSNNTFHQEKKEGEKPAVLDCCCCSHTTVQVVGGQGKEKKRDGQEMWRRKKNNRECECKACQADCWTALLYQTCRSRSSSSSFIRSENKKDEWG